MAHHWKAGDRFNQTLVISNNYVISSIESSIQGEIVSYGNGRYLIHSPISILDNVKPIYKDMDIAKPLRLKDTKAAIEFVDWTASGRMLCRDSELYLFLTDVTAVENIPEEKAWAGMKVVALCKNNVLRTHMSMGVYPDNNGYNCKDIVSRAVVQYIDGTGWSVIEIDGESDEPC